MRWEVSQSSENTKGTGRGECAHPYAERISKYYFSPWCFLLREIEVVVGIGPQVGMTSSVEEPMSSLQSRRFSSQLHSPSTWRLLGDLPVVYIILVHVTRVKALF